MTNKERQLAKKNYCIGFNTAKKRTVELNEEQKELVKELVTLTKNIEFCKNKIRESANRSEALVYAKNKDQYYREIRAIEKQLGLNEVKDD